jgi:hypothetical protein
MDVYQAKVVILCFISRNISVTVDLLFKQIYIKLTGPIASHPFALRASVKLTRTYGADTPGLSLLSLF